uniref:Uncharacterized protein n=1 Tax=Octopus bimaculoides TaxID=37653 RepID=A0A0L8HJT8_OCTBM
MSSLIVYMQNMIYWGKKTIKSLHSHIYKTYTCTNIYSSFCLCLFYHAGILLTNSFKTRYISCN